MGLWQWFYQQFQPRSPFVGSVRDRLLHDPYYRLQSAADIVIAVQLGIKIDANQASVDDWLRLPGLSIHQARSLVALTRAGVHFYCLEDLAAALSVSLQSLKPLEPILQFYYYDPETEGLKVNPNTASLEQLTQIPILEPALAAALVQNRLIKGAYRDLSDLQQRLSLSGSLTAQLMHYLHF